MKQRQREQVQRGCAVGTVVLLAWLCRVLPLEGLPSGLREACGILRSLLYLSLFAGWGISLYNRTVHPQVRRLLLNVDLLMLFWILVRTLRFQLNTPPEIDRMLWYLYYAPMLGMPVLCVQLVLTVDRSERYRLSAWARMLWLPSAVLLELVLTNDLHQQVFRLQQPWNEKYHYGWLFGLVVGWIVICILLAFGIIAHKSRNPRNLRGFFCWPHSPFRQKKTGLLHISVGQSCLAARVGARASGVSGRVRLSARFSFPPEPPGCFPGSARASARC